MDTSAPFRRQVLLENVQNSGSVNAHGDLDKMGFRSVRGEKPGVFVRSRIDAELQGLEFEKVWAKREKNYARIMKRSAFTISGRREIGCDQVRDRSGNAASAPASVSMNSRDARTRRVTSKGMSTSDIPERRTASAASGSAAILNSVRGPTFPGS